MTRLTETRLPEGLAAADLGQAVVEPDGSAALVSYYRTPVAVNRKQTYVVFVLDATLRSQVATYQWQVASVDVDTPDGVWEFTPNSAGDMALNVTLQNGSGGTLKTLSLN